MSSDDFTTYQCRLTGRNVENEIDRISPSAKDLSTEESILAKAGQIQNDVIPGIEEFARANPNIFGENPYTVVKNGSITFTCDQNSSWSVDRVSWKTSTVLHVYPDGKPSLLSLARREFVPVAISMDTNEGLQKTMQGYFPRCDKKTSIRIKVPSRVLRRRENMGVSSSIDATITSTIDRDEYTLLRYQNGCFSHNDPIRQDVVRQALTEQLAR